MVAPFIDTECKCLWRRECGLKHLEVEIFNFKHDEEPKNGNERNFKAFDKKKNSMDEVIKAKIELKKKLL